MTIYLKKIINLSSVEKKKCIYDKVSTKNVDIFESIQDLYNKYYANINNTTDLKCYHEISIENDSLICLFMDIDVNINSLLEPIQEIIKKYKKTETCESESESDLYLLQELINNFLIYLYNKNNNTLSLIHVKNEEKDAVNMPLNEFLNICYKNLTVTKSTCNEKYSYHVYFNNILFNEKDIKSVIKPIITNFIKQENNNIFAKYIDTQIYKSNISLRVVYSKKNNAEDDNINYHYPIKVIVKNNQLKIVQKKIKLTSENIEFYFLTSNTITTNNCDFIYITDLEEIESDDENDVIVPIAFNERSANIYFLSLKHIIKIIFPVNKISLVYMESINHITNLHIYKSDETYENYILKNQELLLEFDYSVHKCIFCKKTSHKNKHYIHAKFYGISIIKKGNSKNCNIYSCSYPTLSEQNICEYVFKENVVKKTFKNELIYFTNNKGWEMIPNDDYTCLKNIMLSYKHFFRSEEIKIIEKLTENKLKEIFKSLSKTIDPVNTMYEYYFKFKNGILELKTEKFYTFTQLKNIYILNAVNYDYKHYSNFDEEEKYKFEFIKTVIDQIIPEKKDNKINPHREIFEANVSSCITLTYKDVITVFQGRTSAGKSTVKKLIASSLNDEINFIEIPISTYTNTIDPNKPNPWLGQIQSKRVSFASESGCIDKINTQTVKHMTENKLLSRKLYMNDVGQTNCLSQFIDTNYDLEFDHEDPAAYRRWAVIKFESFFRKPEDENLMLNINLANNYYRSNKTLNIDIVNNKYSLTFFNLMHIWFLKYHKTNLQMKHTANTSPFCMINKCIVGMGVSGNFVSMEYIIPNKAKNYTKIKYQISSNNKLELIGMNKKYFMGYFSKFLQYHNIDYDLHKIIKDIICYHDNKALIPIVLIEDIKEEFLHNVLSLYKSYNKRDNKDFSLEYYESNKHIFSIQKSNQDVTLVATEFGDI